jgi:hypothetical protein
MSTLPKNMSLSVFSKNSTAHEAKGGKTFYEIIAGFSTLLQVMKFT